MHHKHAANEASTHIKGLPFPILTFGTLHGAVYYIWIGGRWCDMLYQMDSVHRQKGEEFWISDESTVSTYNEMIQILVEDSAVISFTVHF